MYQRIATFVTEDFARIIKIFNQKKKRKTNIKRKKERIIKKRDFRFPNIFDI
jgi:hypothetical protein